MTDRLARLLHPAFLLALAVLVVNDHVLKDVVGNALTGKLSDLAGLVVLPVLASSLLGAGRRAVWAIHGAVGLMFAVLQFVPAEALAAIVPVRHTPDPTDLVALAILPIGVWLSLRASPSVLRQFVRLRPVLTHAVGLAAVGAVLATSPPLVEPVGQTTFPRVETPAQALARLEHAFFVQGFDAERCEPAPFEAWSAPTPEIAARRSADDDSLWTRAYARVVREWEAALAAGHAEYAVPFGAERSGLAEDLRVGLVTRWDSASHRLHLEAWGGGRCGSSGTVTRGLPSYDAADPKAARRAISRRLLRPLREAADPR